MKKTKVVIFIFAGFIMAKSIFSNSIVEAIIGGAFWIGACIIISRNKN